MLGRDEFNHLLSILRLYSYVKLNSLLISEAQHMKYLIEMKDELQKQRSNSKFLIRYHTTKNELYIMKWHKMLNGCTYERVNIVDTF